MQTARPMELVHDIASFVVGDRGPWFCVILNLWIAGQEIKTESQLKLK